MRFLNPLRQFPDRVNMLRVTQGLLPKGIEDSIVLPLEIFVNPYGEPAEDDGDAHAQAETA